MIRPRRWRALTGRPSTPAAPPATPLAARPDSSAADADPTTDTTTTTADTTATGVTAGLGSRRYRVAAVRAAEVAAQPQDWMVEALCADSPDDATWFPAGPPARAKRICAACPVRAECLEYALATSAADGVWGGLTPAERRRLTDGGEDQ